MEVRALCYRIASMQNGGACLCYRIARMQNGGACLCCRIVSICKMECAPSARVRIVTQGLVSVVVLVDCCLFPRSFDGDFMTIPTSATVYSMQVIVVRFVITELSFILVRPLRYVVCKMEVRPLLV